MIKDNIYNFLKIMSLDDKNNIKRGKQRVDLMFINVF